MDSVVDKEIFKLDIIINVLIHYVIKMLSFFTGIVFGVKTNFKVKAET